MRCPKCSYISFDLVESCAKCGKDIGKTADELHGTTSDVELPSFLKMHFDEFESGASAESEDVAGEEMVMDLESEEGEELVDFELEEDSSDEAAAEVDFAFEEEDTASGEVEIEPAVEEEEEPGEAALDISDLSPAEEAAEEIVEEEFAFEEADAAVEEAVPSADNEAKELEDLEVEGIDLESSSAPKSVKIMPSVKTGTALDDFDIDLGDLITSKKK
jgi:hypothetical protein